MRGFPFRRGRRTPTIVFDPVQGVSSIGNVTVVDGVRVRGGRGTTVAVVAPGTVVAPHAVAALAGRLESADIVYADHVVLGPGRRFHKPSWSPELLRSGPYLGPVFVTRRELFERVAPASTGVHDLMIRLSELTGRAVRVPSVWAACESVFGWAPDAGAAAEALTRSGLRGTAALRDATWISLTLTPRRPPSVTIVIPTRDRADLLAPLLRRLDEIAGIPDLRTIIVDNGSTERATVELLADYGTRDTVAVIRDDGPFGFSRLCNQALTRVATDITLFLNNDVLPADPRWLLQLVAGLEAPTVGAVGALLLYPDGRIQHAGVVVGLGGGAGHGFGGARPDDDGYFGLSGVRREVSAVTAACLAVRTVDARRIGGMDEAFVSDFQDVDFCLRLRRDLGLVTIIDPRFPMTHIGSATRGAGDADRDDSTRFRTRWQPVVADDPYYSPRLPKINPGYAMQRPDSSP